ncbi:hypothetical protein SODALDRAFT_71225 [Sodiomyces alkalinus F11]|uniref:Uncharacterized protein n=1 Tax=Sodiomyces alkalinus (strain CBS 110278 / VKM F-3762 / F11) TaxID=1314773 RepID=A0A3N2PMD3_SODAK|nr:hypothetical protein SODALDRAFT_71225 [Sodiomyces alkalinus F11]ROT35629.1 hypothetical protein SODALDRAFT_71225 [Sodiomyces alkalinus F11]
MRERTGSRVFRWVWSHVSAICCQSVYQVSAPAFQPLVCANGLASRLIRIPLNLSRVPVRHTMAVLFILSTFFALYEGRGQTNPPFIPKTQTSSKTSLSLFFFIPWWNSLPP